MSTRCNIIIQKGNCCQSRIYLYHHYDGYPEGVGRDLQKRIDEEYKKWYDVEPYEIANDLIKGQILTESYDYKKDEVVLKGDVGYFLTDQLHSDIDYCYLINVDDLSLTCYDRRKMGGTCQVNGIVNDLHIVKIPKKEEDEKVY